MSKSRLRKSLGELYEQHTGKVSDKWSLYLAEYDRLFAPFREKPIRLLEIGVQNGGSLELWAAFFPKAEAIVGCDINPACAALEYDDPRIRLVVADANTEEGRQQILAQSAGFDLIIDDGSHVSGDIVRSFALYFPHLDEGGAYVAEDLHCSYWEKFTGGLFHPDSSIFFFKKLVDVVNHEHWGIDRSRAEFLTDFEERYQVGFPEGLLRTIHSVEFLNSLCVIEKQAARLNDLGVRIVVGTVEAVAPGLHSMRGHLNHAPDQRRNMWAVQDTASELALRRVEAERRDARIAELQRIVVEREARLAQREAQIAELASLAAAREAEISRIEAVYLNSTSWRVTAPARGLITMLRRLARPSAAGGYRNRLLPRFPTRD
jgi:hypothetical protein